jgi:dihydropteroate synthase
MFLSLQRVQNNVFYTNKSLNVQGKLLDLSTPRVMGIINITPDSFHDGGKFTDPDAQLRHAEKMIREGADLLDIGGYSSRPGATDIPEAEEASRVLPAIERIHKAFPEIPISIDTFRSAIARRGVEAGAAIINDITAGEADPSMFSTVASCQTPYIIMHMRGTPQTMNTMTEYSHLINDIIRYFHPKIKSLHALGVRDVVVDPGFGFAKTLEQNFELLQKLQQLAVLGMPILAGLSRKSMIWRTLGSSPEEALPGTIALQTLALTQGASILRVHDVREAVESIRLLAHLPVEKRIHQKH